MVAILHGRLRIGVLGPADRWVTLTTLLVLSSLKRRLERSPGTLRRLQNGTRPLTLVYPPLQVNRITTLQVIPRLRRKRRDLGKPATVLRTLRVTAACVKVLFTFLITLSTEATILASPIKVLAILFVLRSVTVNLVRLKTSRS